MATSALASATKWPSAFKEEGASFTVQTSNVEIYGEPVNPDSPDGFWPWMGTLSAGSMIYTKYNETYNVLQIIKGSTGNRKDSAGNTYWNDIIGYYIKDKPMGEYDKDSLEFTGVLGKTQSSDYTYDPASGEYETTEAVPDNTSSDTTDADSSNDESSNGLSLIGKAMNVDDAFTESVSYKTYTSSQEYLDNLSKGLRVEDLRAILGMPHQFLPNTDPRLEDTNTVGENEGFGRVYSEKIIKNIPLLLMTPGIPKFMAGFSTEQKNKIIGKLKEWTTETLDSIFGDGSGKYYSLKYAYTDYFNYVNAMLRSAAYFLEIQDEKIDGKTLGTLNWLYATAQNGEGDGGVYLHGNLADFLGPYAGSIAFYADAGTTVDESFGNSTAESQLASALGGLSDQARELNFLIGNVGGMAGVNLDVLSSSEVNETIETLTDKVNKVTGGSNIFSNILGKATNILAGGRIIFPEIWSDSSFSRSYSCSMKLVSPSGDKLSVYLNILVPIYHLLGFTLPRQADNQAYFSPFLVRAYYKGLFNVDMGIIPGLSITKGEEGEWTIDGIPTVANVSFEIKDLYDGMYMSQQSLDDDKSILSNIQELDYIANSCGINVNDQEVMRTIKMYFALGFGSITDKVTIDIFGKVGQYFNQKMQNIFGVFK